MIANMEQAARPKRGWVVIVGLSYLFAVFTAFAAVVSAGEAWVEYRHRQWPEVSARIEHCDVKPYQRSTGRRLPHSAYYIACAVSYETAENRLVLATVTSHRIKSPELAGTDTRPQLKRMQAWVDRHPAGASLDVHYDPAHQQRAVLTNTDMPLGGPERAANNLKLILACAGAWGLLWFIGRAVRPPSYSH